MTRKHWFVFYLFLAFSMIMAGCAVTTVLLLAKHPALEVVFFACVFAAIAARDVYRALGYLIPKTMTELG